MEPLVVHHPFPETSNKETCRQANSCPDDCMERRALDVVGEGDDREPPDERLVDSIKLLSNDKEDHDKDRDEDISCGGMGRDVVLLKQSSNEEHVEKNPEPSRQGTDGRDDREVPTPPRRQERSDDVQGVSSTEDSLCRSLSVVEDRHSEEDCGSTHCGSSPTQNVMTYKDPSQTQQCQGQSRRDPHEVCMYVTLCCKQTVDVDSHAEEHQALDPQERVGWDDGRSCFFDEVDGVLGQGIDKTDQGQYGRH